MQRFLRLLSKQTKENYKTYLLSLAVMVGILSLLMGMVTYANHGSLQTKVQAAFFVNFLVFSGAIFTSMIFADLGDKKKAIPVLTLPVSNFERFLVGWIYSFVIFQLVFTTSFFAIDFILITLGNTNPVIKNEMVVLWSEQSEILMAYEIFVVIHAIMLLGAIFFEKLHFIKTAFFLFIFVIALILISQPFTRMLFADVEHIKAVPFIGVNVQDNVHDLMVNPDRSANMITAFMAVAVTLLLWTAAFFKLKEKQV